MTGEPHDDKTKEFPRVAHVGNVKEVNANGVWQVTEHLCELSGGTSEVWHFTRSVDEVTERRVRRTTIFDIPVRGLPVGLGGRIQWLTRSARRWLTARQSEIDCLHLHSVMQPDHLRVWRVGRPYVVTPHNGYNAAIYRRHYGKRLWRRLFDVPMLQRAEVVHVLSEAEREEVLSIAPKAMVRKANNPLRIESDWSTGSYCSTGAFLFIGRLAMRQKGLDRLLAGYSEYAALVDAPRPLILCGPDDRGDRRVLEDRALALGIASNVTFLSQVDRSGRDGLLARASAFVHTSRWEGQPLAPHEAMLAGVPVIVTPETHMGELVLEHQAGYVCDSTPAAIARALWEFDALPERDRAAMGQRAKHAVRLKFDQSAIASDWLSIYRLVVGGRK